MGSFGFWGRNEGKPEGKADPSLTTPKLKNAWGPVLSG